MSEPTDPGSTLSLLTLRYVRKYIRRSHAVMMTAFFTIVYALGSMVLGGMLILSSLQPPYFTEVLWSGGAPAWNYPGVLSVQSWGILQLPFFATFSMVVVSIGVGIGMSIAVLLGIALIKNRRARAGQPAAVGSIAGLTPAMIALVTLGACCSTTAAATAGVGLVGQVSGTTVDNLLANNWYLGVFQMVVVWVALVAQELLLRVYGGLFRLGATPGGVGADTTPARLDRRAVIGGLLRAALLVGGLTWSLAMLVDWTRIAPASASGTEWYNWIVQHQLLAVFAVLAALFPRGVGQALRMRGSTLAGWALRGVLLVGGVSLAIGVPPPFSSWGAAGFGNELLSVLGGSSTWAASPPVFGPGLDLYFRWGVQYLLLGGFAIVVAISPRRAMSPILWSAAQPRAASIADVRGGPVTRRPAAAMTESGVPALAPASEAPRPGGGAPDS